VAGEGAGAAQRQLNPSLGGEGELERAVRVGSGPQAVRRQRVLDANVRPSSRRHRNAVLKVCALSARRYEKSNAMAGEHMQQQDRILLKSAVVVTVLVYAEPSYAYMGPGSGLAAIGSLLSLVGAVLLAIVGFVWFPLKRLLRKRSAAKTVAASEPDQPAK
jgi:hypothetical protein